MTQADLAHWHRTRMADYQYRYERPRRDWWAWCGEVLQPCADIGCGLYGMPKALGVDLAFGDVRADALRLPFVDGAFASIVSSHLIEHVPPRALLAECSRVLRPGGHLYLEAPNLMGLARMWRVWRTGIRDGRYPCGGKTLGRAVLAGVLAYRYWGRLVWRLPCLDVPFAGRDPDAVWWCNGLAAMRLLAASGFRPLRASGLFGHTFRLEAIRAT